MHSLGSMSLLFINFLKVTFKMLLIVFLLPASCHYLLGPLCGINTHCKYDRNESVILIEIFLIAGETKVTSAAPGGD